MTNTTWMLLAALVPGVDSGEDDRLARHVRQPTIALWTDRDEVVRPNQSVRVYFRSETDAYVTIFQVDTDGWVEVLFPQDPWDNNYARGGRRYEARRHGNRYAFRADAYPGQGYLFAVSSRYPFRYAALAFDARWDVRAVGHGGRITGDPYVALMDLMDVIVPADHHEVDYDIVPYFVERRYEYPRFLCYDCHAYVRYARWDPYADPCFRFGIVVYDDPHYYPARAYDGRRVVFSRPRRLEARFVFRERSAALPYVERVRERGTGTADRRETPGRIFTGGDARGPGRVAAPQGAPEPSPRRRAGGAADRPTRLRPEGDRPAASPGPERPAPRRVPAPVTGAPGGARDDARATRPAPGDSGAAATRPALQRRSPAPRPPAEARRPAARPGGSARPDTTSARGDPRRPPRRRGRPG